MNSINTIVKEVIDNYLNNIIKEYHDIPRLPFEEFGNYQANGLMMLAVLKKMVLL